MSKIEWTDRTWSPVVGCTRVSAGCDNCYAVRMTRRLESMGQEKYSGLVNEGRGHFNGVARLHSGDLDKPLRWRKPCRVFVNPMSDLFHERLSDADIAAVFGVMAVCPQHTFQVLTKRPERMFGWFTPENTIRTIHSLEAWVGKGAPFVAEGRTRWMRFHEALLPLPNVWLGVSCEDEATADERIPLLLRTPAAVRFVSAEPLLGPIDLAWYIHEMRAPWYDRHAVEDGLAGNPEHAQHWDRPALDWVIVGGESGPGARPCRAEWIRSLVCQCQDAGVRCFVKQTGPRLYFDDGRGWTNMRDRKGGDPAEWPEDLRVREMPGMTT